MKRFTLPLAAALTLVCLWGAAPAAAGLVPVRMTGGGTVVSDNPLVLNPVVLSMILQCKPGDEPNHLRMADTNRFSLEIDTVTSAFCAPNSLTDPQAGGVYRGTGIGTCNGLPASASWTFVDLAHASLNFLDAASVTVTGQAPLCNFSVSGPLDGGNLRMHIVVAD